MSQVSEANLDLLVDILNDVSPYQVELLDRLEKETVAYCDEYATHLARLQYLRPKIVRNHQAYVRLGGGSLQEYTRLELAAPAPALAPAPEAEPVLAPVETTALALAAAVPSQLTYPVDPAPEKVPARRHVKRGKPRPRGSQLSMDEYATFVNMVKQVFGVYPHPSIIARYHHSTLDRVYRLRYEAVQAGRLPRFANPAYNARLLGKITEAFGPYKIAAKETK